MLGDIVRSADQFAHAVEDSPTEALLGEVAKEAFHHVEPRGTGGREVHMEAWMPIEPAFHLGVFVGARSYLR